MKLAKRVYYNHRLNKQRKKLKLVKSLYSKGKLTQKEYDKKYFLCLWNIKHCQDELEKL